MSAPPKHAKRTPFLLLLLGLFAGGMGLLLVLNTASAANEVSRHDVAAKGQRVEAQVQDLREQVARSAAPGNLAGAAAQLGMVPAGNPAFLVVASDGRVIVMGHPGAASEPPVAAPKTSKASKSTSAPATKSGSASPGATSSAKTTTTTPPTTTPPSSTPTPTVTLGGGTR